MCYTQQQHFEQQLNEREERLQQTLATSHKAHKEFFTTALLARNSLTDLPPPPSSGITVSPSQPLGLNLLFSPHLHTQQHNPLALPPLPSLPPHHHHTHSNPPFSHNHKPKQHNPLPFQTPPSILHP